MLESETTQHTDVGKSEAEIQAWLVEQISKLLVIDPKQIDTQAAFSSYGLSSRDAIMLSGDLEEWLGRRLSPTLIYEYPTIDNLVSYLTDGTSPATDNQVRQPITPTVEANAIEQKVSSLETLSDEDAEVILLQKLRELR